MGNIAQPPKRKRGRPKGIPAHNRKSIEQHKAEGTYRSWYHKPDPTPLKLVKPKLTRLPSKKDTAKYVRSHADELAVANGCRFSERLADYFLEWVKKYIRLSEGMWAGQPFVPMDWQRDEIFYPLFGWVRKHPDHGRICRRYRKVYCEVPKKNGKSPTAAVVGVYMLMGDGEHGANVFSVATDKDQAAIVHSHAIHMVESSPELLDLCKINRTNKAIAFNSKLNKKVVGHGSYSVIASIPAGREGINASCLIADELHVWQGDQLYNALKYAFRSRLEPVFFQITTAGDNMDSVCREQHEYAQGVINGDIKDDSFLPVIYGIDKEEEDDWANEDLWARANPSLGTTVMLSDLKADAQEAKDSARKVATFKRYTLNVWSSPESVWLDRDSWLACGDDYTEADLEGQKCYAGLDLSRSRDMTALVLLFPGDGGVYRQLVYFWMPRQTVDERAHLADYTDWVDNGCIEVTPGHTIDLGYVEEKIVQLGERFNILEIGYDPWSAQDLTQRLEEQHGFKRTLYRQGMISFAGPSAEYERLVLEGKMLNNGHPVLTWQAGHCMIETDKNKNIRPVKRTKGDYRTVDGIVAAVMALGLAVVDHQKDSVYDTRGLVRL